MLNARACEPRGLRKTKAEQNLFFENNGISTTIKDLLSIRREENNK